MMEQPAEAVVDGGHLVMGVVVLNEAARERIACDCFVSRRAATHSYIKNI